VTSRRSDASFRAGRLSNHVSEEFSELLQDGKLTFHTLSFLGKKKKRGEDSKKSQVERVVRHPVSPLPVVCPGQVQGALEWAPGAGACMVCTFL